jgi:gamma-glutamyl-gamma-aminobutyrate hydrolase PuuD
MKNILISPHYSQKDDISRLCILTNLSDFLIEKEFLPIILATKSDCSELDDLKIENLINYYLNLKVEGIILTGGSSIDPIFHDFEEDFTCKSQVFRDIFELKLVKKALDLNIPILGICRGLQIINIALNGTLKYVPTHKKSSHILAKNPNQEGEKMIEDMRRDKLHNLKFRENSLILKILKEKYNFKGRSNSIWVNSIHSQVINKLANELTLEATSDDGEIEVVSNITKKILGLQFHPEIDIKDQDYQNFLRLWLNWI